MKKTFHRAEMYKALNKPNPNKKPYPAGGCANCTKFRYQKQLLVTRVQVQFIQSIADPSEDLTYKCLRRCVE